jgi:hypothetical protein
MGPTTLQMNLGRPAHGFLHVPERTESALKRSAWIARCEASIMRREPSLGWDDVEDLAYTLWDRPGCRRATPELSVHFLFMAQLSRLR